MIDTSDVVSVKNLRVENLCGFRSGLCLVLFVAWKWSAGTNLFELTTCFSIENKWHEKSIE